MSDSQPIQRTVRLKIVQGLHIRACSGVVAIMDGFEGRVQIHYGNKSADASSMFDLMLLAALPNSELSLEAEGEGSELILDQIEDFLSHPSVPQD